MGLPLHPLIVHAVVVLVPLSAAGGLAIVVLKAARKRYGSLVVAGSALAVVTTFVAQQAGRAFAASREQLSPATMAHMQLGGGLLLWVILLFVGVLVVMIGQRLLDRQQARGRLALLSGSAITVVCALISIIQVVRIGHSGASAVWG